MCWEEDVDSNFIKRLEFWGEPTKCFLCTLSTIVSRNMQGTSVAEMAAIQFSLCEV